MLKRTSYVLLTLAGFVLLAGCTSGPTIRTDFDPSVDFSQYKTFGFFSPMNIEGENYSTMLGDAFRESIGKQMRALGYVESDSPDLGINVSANLREKIQTTSSTDPMISGGYYGYRRGFYNPWMSYGLATTTHVSQYTEGTVNIDVVDMAQKRMVWEGVAIGRVKEGRSNAEVREAINDGVAEMFAGYRVQVRQ